MASVVSLESVSVVRGGTAILAPMDLQIESDQRWVVIGPNGAGKTTLLRLLAAQLHPTTGITQLLGHRLGRVDVFELRPRIGFAANAQAQQIPPGETVRDAVLTAAYAVTGRWREEYEDVDIRRAEQVLEQWRLLDKIGRTVGTLSDGEKKRVQIARALMTDPELLLLDEPVASLDVGAREEFITLLGDYAAAADSPTMVMVTHHLEEIPPGFTHALLLSKEGVVARGPIAETLTSAKLSETFGLPLTVSTRGDRYTAWASASI